MQYKSLHFDNEVINALYSPKDREYWKFYMESFVDQLTNNLNFIESRPDIQDDYILANKKSSVQKMKADLHSLVGDILSADYDSPIGHYIKSQYELMEIYAIACEL